MPPTLSPHTIAPPPSQPPVAPLDDSGIRITNVSRSFWHYLLKHKLWQLLPACLLLLAWEGMVIYFLVVYLRTPHGDSSDTRVFGYAMLLPLIGLQAWLYRLWSKFEDVFLAQFAAANGLAFAQHGSVSETYGSIFRLRGAQKVSDIITGTYNGSDLRVFLYELTVGSGRSRQVYHETVLELDLRGTLPSLLLVSKQSKFLDASLNLVGAFGSSHSISLEGDFNRYFTLYALPGNEVEALEVFNPDLMALMEDESKQYTVEFAGNRIYIYIRGYLSRSSDLQQAFTLAKRLSDKVAPLASQLAHDSAMTVAPVNLGAAQVRATSATTYIVGALLAVVLTGVLTAGFWLAGSRTTATPVTRNSGPPDCGIDPAAALPADAKLYTTALLTLNSGEWGLSQKLETQNLVPDATDYQTQLTLDRNFLTSVGAITFPASMASDVAAQRQAFIAYDSQVALELEQYPNVTDAAIAARNGAAAARHAASVRIRTDLQLSPATCAFTIP